jgi:hypothetical protein
MRRVALLVLLAACAPPMTIDHHSVLGELTARYPAFFPDGEGLVHPRLGDPEIARSGTAFAVELLRRDGAPAPRAALVERDLADADARRCVDGENMPGCWPLRLVETAHERIDGKTQALDFAASAEAPPPAGGYDLAVDGARAARAVWLRDFDPAAPRPIHVVQLSDLHAGREPVVSAARLAEVIRAVNALAPDVVIVTGDLVEHGDEDEAQVRRLAALLVTVEAPLLTVMGGHDIGMSFAARSQRRYGAGWEHHARAFHPLLETTLTLGGWDFVGFDTGPSVGLIGSLDRGIAPDTVAWLHARLAAARAAGRRGVVLMSHAPSRASLFDNDRGLTRGNFAQMRWGGDAFEDMLLDAAARGQRVVHLAGHTHWSDVYVSGDGPFGFARWPSPSPCWRRIDAAVALVTTQSATLAGWPFRASARGHGFAELILDEGVRVAHRRFGSADDLKRCPALP